MRNIRIIARLDVKSEHLVKGIQLEGLRKLGKPNDFARKYYSGGIDEIIYVDIVASLYERNSLLPIIEKASDDIFIPMTVTGGIRSVENARAALHAGADKVGVNTAAIKNPQLISDIAEEFGSQCMVASIEAKNTGAGTWEAYYDNGREKTGISVLDWAKELEQRGAGEILLTSVDREGAGKGMDTDLISAICDTVNIPVIASGGVGNVTHMKDVINQTNVSAIAVAKTLHYEETTIADIKDELRSIHGVEIR
ncbi:MAG: imidazole glycerol phosphate synthase subunit HisF [Rickettsiales bacterium]